MSQWREICRLEGWYSISDLGKIRNNKTGRFLKTKFNKSGYEVVNITYKGNSFSFQIHRLVLLAFNPIPNAHLFDVDHIDWNITNNNLKNLRWLPKEENKLRRRVIQKSFCLFTSLLIKYGDDVLEKKLRELL